MKTFSPSMPFVISVDITPSYRAPRIYWTHFGNVIYPRFQAINCSLYYSWYTLGINLVHRPLHQWIILNLVEALFLCKYEAMKS
jgi:hypothetical protein